MDPADILLFILTSLHLVYLVCYTEIFGMVYLWILLFRTLVLIYLCILFSGKLYRFYGEGLLPLINEMVFKSFVFAHSHFLFCAPPGSR